MGMNAVGAPPAGMDIPPASRMTGRMSLVPPLACAEVLDPRSAKMQEMADVGLDCLGMLAFRFGEPGVS